MSLKCLFACSILASTSFLKQPQKSQTALLNNLIGIPVRTHVHVDTLLFLPSLAVRGEISFSSHSANFSPSLVVFLFTCWPGALPCHFLLSAPNVSLKTDPLAYWRVCYWPDPTRGPATIRVFDRKYEMQRQGFLHRPEFWSQLCYSHCILSPSAS